MNNLLHTKQGHVPLSMHIRALDTVDWQWLTLNAACKGCFNMMTLCLWTASSDAPGESVLYTTAWLVRLPGSAAPAPLLEHCALLQELPVHTATEKVWHPYRLGLSSLHSAAYSQAPSEPYLSWKLCTTIQHLMHLYVSCSKIARQWSLQ